MVFPKLKVTPADLLALQENFKLKTVKYLSLLRTS
jgi:hypothetical protein